MTLVYTDKVKEHIFEPKNIGEIENADGMGEVGNPQCGDMMRITVKVEDGKLADVKWKTLGCGAAIATSSMMSEMVKGKTVEEAFALTRDMVANALGGLPSQKMHCSNLAADGLHAALEDYIAKQKTSKE